MNNSFDWQRQWFRANERASLAEAYLQDSQLAFAPAIPSGIALSELRGTPCVILLGTPGMGKTTEMFKEAKEARKRNELVTFISLSSLSTPEALGAELNRTIETDLLLTKSICWNIFLDGLDEVLTDLSQIQKAIPQQLRTIAERGLLNNVRLRISCRTAEWPTAFEAELKTLWEKDEVAVLQLERLRREDVAVAARQVLGENDADKFIKQISSYEAEPLASRPVTLRMLLNVFQQQGDFPKQQQEVYRRGLLAFIQESNVARRKNRQTWHLDVMSKLIVAGRIAAATVLSDSNEIWTGLYADLPPSRAVALLDIAGGHEPSMGSSFQVGEAELHEVLLTALFTPVSEECFVFAHRTFSEFLTAYYLNQHELDSDQLFDLLKTSEDTRLIPPQLREVSAWLAGMHPDFFRSLARSQPDILLQSDVASASVEDRELLVGQLMLAFEHEEIHDFDYQIRRRYSRLRHPNLAKQLQPYIKSKDVGVVARRVAIDIAQENKLTELAPLLLAIALDRAENHHIRSQAVAAIADFDMPEVTYQLLPLAVENNSEDVNDDLKGWALRALYPRYISVPQLLKILTREKQDNYIGSYHMFLSELRLDELGQSDAVAIISWASSWIDDSETLSPFERIIPRFLAEAWRLADDDKVLDAFAEFFNTIAATHKYFSVGHYFEKFITESVRESPTQKRRLIAKILKSAGAEKKEIPLSLIPAGGGALLSNDDLEWLIEQLTSRSSGISEDVLTDLIVRSTYGRDIDALPEVWDVSSIFPELARKLSAAYSVELGSTNAKWLREEGKRLSELLATRKSSVEFNAVDALEKGLEKIEREGPAYWWELNLLFFAQSDGRLDGNKELSGNLTKLPLWTALSPVDQERVVAAAYRYIVEYRPSSKWIGKNVFHRPAAAGYRAFRLLDSESPEKLQNLGVRQWSKWAAAILLSDFDSSGEEQDAHKTLAFECYRLVPQQVRRVVHRILTKDHSSFTAQKITSLLSNCYDEALGALLMSLIEDTSVADDLHLSRNQVLLIFLVRKRHPAAVAITTHALNAGSPIDGTALSTTKQFAAVVSSLLEEQPHLIWQQFLNLTKSNEVLAKEVVTELAQSWRFDRGEDQHNYSESDLSDLVVWLFRAFPDREESESSRARWVSSVDQVEHFRTALLRSLVTKGTKESVSAVAKIASAIPDRPWLRYQLVDARRAMSANTWRLRAPSEIIELISKRNPPTKFKSTKATIGEAAHAFQNANMEIAATVAILEKSAETFELHLREKERDEFNPRRVLAVATEWTSKHGGITTLNREMCIALSALGHEIVCAVIESTESEKSDALSKHVRLVDAPEFPTVENENRLLMMNRKLFGSFEPNVVIGHDHITGAAGHHLAKSVFEVPYVHFVHTLPEGAERHKTRHVGNILDGSKKAETQKKQCTLSDLVVCVGPLIHRTLQTALLSYEVPVVEFRPGLDGRLLAKKIDTKKILATYCLFLARLEDGILKGADIACHVVAALNSNWKWDRYKLPLLIMRGFDEETIDRDLSSLGDIHHARPYVLPRGYTADVNIIADDICMSSVVMMPSRVEAFGLVALEAIAAGVPVLIASSSGVGELLMILAAESQISQQQADACVTDIIDGDMKATIQQWSNKAQAIITNPKAAFGAADTFRSMLAPLLSWENAAKALMCNIEQTLHL